MSILWKGVKNLFNFLKINIRILFYTISFITLGDFKVTKLQVIQHYVDIWSSNQTEEEFKQVLDSICRTLGQPDRIDRCLNIVDNYYIPFFNFLIHELNPRTACQAVGLCGPGGFLKVYQIISPLISSSMAYHLPNSSENLILCTLLFLG